MRRINTTDLKELIPEFYTGSGEFLVNFDDLDLGHLHTGTFTVTYVVCAQLQLMLVYVYGGWYDRIPPATFSRSCCVCMGHAMDLCPLLLQSRCFAPPLFV